MALTLAPTPTLTLPQALIGCWRRLSRNASPIVSEHLQDSIQHARHCSNRCTDAVLYLSLSVSLSVSLSLSLCLWLAVSASLSAYACLSASASLSRSRSLSVSLSLRSIRDLFLGCGARAAARTLSAATPRLAFPLPCTRLTARACCAATHDGA